MLRKIYVRITITLEEEIERFNERFQKFVYQYQLINCTFWHLGSIPRNAVTKDQPWVHQGLQNSREKGCEN